MTRTPRRIVLSYSIGSIGTGIFLTVPGVLLLYYMSEILGIPAALAGLAVFIPRIWDMVTDPVMGWISDRTRTPWGRRRPYLLAGAILTALSFVFLFNAPEFAQSSTTFFYVLTIYVLSATAYTIFAVPYLAMPSEMSPDSNDRASIMAYRMTFAMAGVLAGSAAAPALVAAFGGGRDGFAAMSFVLGGICALTMLISFIGTARAPALRPTTTPDRARPSIFIGFANRDFRMLAIAYCLQLGGLGTFTAAAPFYINHVAGRDEAALSTLFLSLLAGTMISLFVWAALGRAIGKVRAYLLAAATVLASITAVWFAKGPEDWTALLLVTGAIGVGFGGLQVLPFAMLTDVVHHARERGEDLAGVLTGVWTAVEKGGLAVGPLIVGGVLSAGGFVSAAAMQTETAILAVRIAFAAGPALLVLVSLPAILAVRQSLGQEVVEVGT
jgi:Na+/melibiose symporter-like transporter